jgi:hypothetical protein
MPITSPHALRGKTPADILAAAGTPRTVQCDTTGEFELTFASTIIYVKWCKVHYYGR